MKNIYVLKIGNHPIYVGQTVLLWRRLEQHIKTAPFLKELPDWIIDLITIELLEECSNNANARERYWILYFRNQGFKLKNNNHFKETQSAANAKGFKAYKRMTNKEILFIRVNLYKDWLLENIKVTPEAIRQSLNKNRIKCDHYNHIFSGANLLRYKQLHGVDHPFAKINLE